MKRIREAVYKVQFNLFLIVLYLAIKRDDYGRIADMSIKALLAKKVNAGRISTTDLVNSIFNFCEIYSGITLFPYQEQFSKRVIRSVLENDGEEITALFSRQSGKSETISVTVGGLMIILPQLANMPMFADDPRLAMFKDGFWIGIFAPALRQSQITYNRIKSRLQSKSAKAVLEDPEFNLFFSTSNGQTVALSNGSYATAISASDGSNIEGDSFKLIICEECQDISNYKIRKSIHPMGAAYNATIVKIGTATTFKGDFYEAIQRNKSLMASKTTHIRNHFEYDWKIAAKYNEKYRRYVEKEMKRLGENSDEFQMSYCLKWILSRGMFVDIVKFEQENCDPFLDRVSYDKRSTHCAGIDLGGKNDSTIVTIVEVDWSKPVIMESRVDEETGEEIMYQCYNTYLVDWLEIRNMPDYEEQYPLVVDYLKHFNVVRCFCDATREASFSHRLRANSKFEVIPYVFSTKAKSEMYKNLEREIVSGRAKVAGSESAKSTSEHTKFIEQLGELQKGWSGSNMIVSHPTEATHDDYPDSWALAVLACATPGEVNNTETTANKFREQTSWQRTQSYRVNNVTARRRR